METAADQSTGVTKVSQWYLTRVVKSKKINDIKFY